ncbi:MAG TPA: PDZ domain-containing protein [Thermoanaerobaculia bacterium]|nr:PDZ domain-containing protein [Thermoanaerobaculia bacterium]
MRRPARRTRVGLLLFFFPSLFAAGAEPRCPKPLDVCVAEKRQLFTHQGVLGFLWSAKPGGDGRPAPGEYGLAVQVVPSGYPAKAAGLREGDVLLAMDGKDLAGVPVEQFLQMSAAVAPGQTVSYRILRAGAKREIRITAAPPTSRSIDAWIGQHVRESHSPEDYRRYLLQLKAGAKANPRPP